MTKLVNRAKVKTTTTGTGTTITLGSVIPGYQSFTSAGVLNADVVRYAIEQDAEWEIGTGTYSSAGNTLTRTVTESSNAGAPINLTGNADVYVTAAADDLLQPQDIGITVQGYSAALQGTTASYTTALNSKLNGIEAGATADQTAAEILTAIKTVDGTGTGLDADLLDGQHGTYYTGYTDTAIANLVATAPATLDTLNELATALGNDPNFATTVTTSISTKAPINNATFTGTTVVPTADINGGTIDGTVIGGSTPAAISGTTITGTSFVTTGDMNFGDNDKAIFGAGSDLQIYHNGSNSFIDDVGTGNLFVRANNLRLSNADNSQYYLIADNAGFVKLNYAGAEKLSTTATGIDVTGTVTASGDISTTGGDVDITGTQPRINLKENDTTDLDVTLRLNYGDFIIETRSDAGSALGDRIRAAANGDISFYEDTGATPKFFWDASAEALGIGTSAPRNVLHAHNADNGGIRFSNTATGSGASDGFYVGNVFGSTDALLQNYEAGDIRFSTSSTERLRITSTGSVGIGTSSPSTALDVTGTVTADGLVVDGNITVTGTVDGRDISADGTKLDGIEVGADVTDTANVTAAGAVMQTTSVGSALIPTGTEAQRDAVPSAGYFRFNSDVAKFEGYNGSAWGSVGGGATGGGSDAVFIENDQTINANYTVVATKNAMTTGPIEVASGVTVTIEAGARWVVI